ncbi:MAG TPA: GtrA family protein [Candidatus Paceibacterota bacterium]|nr:GtrA family protein [Candidatus Paceibacterota bacterium]
MSKKDIIFSVIIGLLIGFLIWPLWLNLGVLLNYWSYRWVVVIVCPVIAILVVIVAFWLRKISAVIWQFAKYALVGVLNTLLDFGILNLLSYVTKIYQGGWIVFFNFFSFFIANINSYFWNKYWTFDRGDKAKTQEFAKFFVVSLIGFGLNSFVLWAITSVSPLMNLTPPQWENVGKLGGTIVSLIWNFVGYKIFVFKK